MNDIIKKKYKKTIKNNFIENGAKKKITSKKNTDDISINGGKKKKIASKKNTDDISINGGTKKKITSKKIQHGNGIIPYFSDNIVTSVQSSVDTGINNVENFFRKIKQDYVNSVQKAASVKIGDQRLIQGGNKEYIKLTKNISKSKSKSKSKK